MVNPFPILYLSLMAHFLLRLTIGSILIYFGLQHASIRTTLKEVLPRKSMLLVLLLSTFECGIGVLFILGAFTQYAALASMALCLVVLTFGGHKHHSSFPPSLTYILLFAISLSLFITGAGALAFDLPI